LKTLNFHNEGVLNPTKRLDMSLKQRVCVSILWGISETGDRMNYICKFKII